eukprot:GGOE01000250.1.p1 GENE.GGOE01000250.1~~GGOE01000250.1.p1  ORF type:complete len:831 (+),score=124.12 GGOE01000250.1:31-2523(+)
MITSHIERGFIAVSPSTNVVHLFHQFQINTIFLLPGPISCFAFDGRGLLIIVLSSSIVFVVDPAQSRSSIEKAKFPHPGSEFPEESPFDLKVFDFEVIEMNSSDAANSSPRPANLPAIHLLIHDGTRLLAIGSCGGCLQWSWVHLSDTKAAHFSFSDAGPLQTGEVPSAALLSTKDRAFSPLLQVAMCDTSGDLLLVGTSSGRVLAIALHPDKQQSSPVQVACLSGALLCLAGLKLEYALSPPLEATPDGHWNAAIFLTNEGDVFLQTLMHLRQYRLPMRMAAAAAHGPTLYAVDNTHLYTIPLQTKEANWTTAVLPASLRKADVSSTVDVAEMLVPRQWSLGPVHIRSFLLIPKANDGLELAFFTATGELNLVPLSTTINPHIQHDGMDMERELRNLLHDIQQLDAAQQETQAETEAITSELQQMSHAMQLWQRNHASVETVLQVSWTFQHNSGAFASCEGIAGALHLTPAFSTARTGHVPFDLCLHLSNTSRFTFTRQAWALVLTFDQPQGSTLDIAVLSALRFNLPLEPRHALSYSVPLALEANSSCVVKVPIRGGLHGSAEWRCCAQLVYASPNGGLLRFHLAEHTFQALDLFVVQPQSSPTSGRDEGPPGPASNSTTTALLRKHNERQAAATLHCPHQTAPSPVSGYTQTLPIWLPTPMRDYAEFWSVLLSHTPMAAGGEPAGAPLKGHNLLAARESYAASVVLHSPFGGVVRCRATSLQQQPIDLLVESSDSVSLLVVQAGVLRKVQQWWQMPDRPDPLSLPPDSSQSLAAVLRLLHRWRTRALSLDLEGEGSAVGRLYSSIGCLSPEGNGGRRMKWHQEQTFF